MTLTDRQIESLDTNSHLVVTAGAGSGKTKVLVERYMSVLRNEDKLLPENILALTFTEKASLEMKERIRNEVSDLADREGGRWEEILDDVEDSDISTIHSFCTSMIRADPIPLGLDPDVVVLSETETSFMIKEVLKRTFTTPGPESDSLRRLIVDIGQYAVVNMIKGIIRDRSRLPFDLDDPELMRSSKMFHSRTAKDLLDRAESDLDEMISSLHALSRLDIPAEPGDSGVKAITGISEVLSLVRKGAEGRDVMAALSRSRDVLLTKNGKERSSSRLGNSRAWGGDIRVLKDSMAHLYSYVHAYQDILIFVEKEGLMDRTRERITDLLEVVEAVNSRYVIEKRKANGLDFDDQISYAMRLLERNENDVLTRFRKKFKHVLFDEFQDTDPRQWRLAELLWNQGNGCTLFVVGDPKQSIYGFRSADVRLFMKATGLLRENDRGKVVVLDRNFRSKTEVMGFVNSVFPKVFKDESTDWSVPFDPLAPHRSIGGSVSVVGVVGKQGAEAREGRMASEIITRAIRGWDIEEEGVRREIRFSDIAILIPTRRGFERYEEALRNASIPYHVYNGRGFFERQEIADVLELLEFLTDPNNDIALASILRGPFFSLSDEELMTIASHSGRSLWTKLIECGEFREISMVLEIGLNMAGTEIPYLVLERIFEMTGIHATSGGRRQYRNIDRLLEWILESRKSGDLWEIRNELRMMMEEPPKEGEPPVSRDDDSVTILTVHASKGLEWPMVMVLGLNHEGRGDQWSNYRVHPDHGVALKVLDTTTGEMVKTPAWSFAGEENDLREMEERKRLFYVACTRARDHLVLSGVIPVDRNGMEQEPRGLMKLLKEGMDLSLEDLEEPTKTIGDVEVRLFCVKPGEDTVPDEEEEQTLEEIGIKEVSKPGSCDPIERGGPEFRNPTGTEVLSMLGMDTDNGIYPRRGVTADGPAPDELGEIVHRVLEGVPLKRLMREYGFAGDEIEARIKLMVDEMRERALEFNGRQYREVELVGHLTTKDGTKVPLKGRVDLLVEREDGSLVVVDYKTGRERVEHKAQMTAYQHMLKGKTEGEIETRTISPGNNV